MLAYVMCGQTSLSVMGVDYAVVPIGEEKVARLVELAREVGRQKERQKGYGVKSVKVPDEELLVFRTSQRLMNMSSPHHPRHLLYRAVKRANSYVKCELITYDLLGNEEECRKDRVEVSEPTANVHDDEVYWTAWAEGSEHVHLTGPNFGDLLLARLYYAAPAERAAVFRELAEWSPGMAGSVLEWGSGFSAWSRSTSRRSSRGRPSCRF